MSTNDDADQSTCRCRLTCVFLACIWRFECKNCTNSHWETGHIVLMQDSSSLGLWPVKNTLRYKLTFRVRAHCPDARLIIPWSVTCKQTHWDISSYSESGHIVLMQDLSSLGLWPVNKHTEILAHIQRQGTLSWCKTHHPLVCDL